MKKNKGLICFVNIENTKRGDAWLHATAFDDLFEKRFIDILRRRSHVTTHFFLRCVLYKKSRRSSQQKNIESWRSDALAVSHQQKISGLEGIFPPNVIVVKFFGVEEVRKIATRVQWRETRKSHFFVKKLRFLRRKLDCVTILPEKGHNLLFLVLKKHFAKLTCICLQICF